MDYQVERVIPNLRAQAIINNSIIASQGYSIYKSDDIGESWKKCGSLPVVCYKRALSAIRSTEKLFRKGISQIKQISKDSILICSDGSFYLSDRNFEKFDLIDIPIRAFQVLDNSICVTSHYIYYGEYFPNFKRESVNIFRSRDGLNWERIHSFPKHTIKHIHLIQYDPFFNMIWFSTGDNDMECSIGFSDFDFSKIEIIGKGNQNWRTLEILFEKDKIFWGTDSPDQQNKLISFNRFDGKTNVLSKLNGPIYNLKKISGGFLAITAVEHGKGEYDNNARVWFCKNLSDPWSELLKYKKEWIPLIFGFGRLSFGGEIGDKLFFSAQCLKDVDNSTIVLTRCQKDV